MSSPTLAQLTEHRHQATHHLAQFFVVTHLEPYLQWTAQQSADLARAMIVNLADGPELTAGLRKLLEAKDCFVRQVVTELAERDAEGQPGDGG